MHSGARVQTSAWVSPLAKELFQIIPTLVMNREIIPDRKRGFDTCQFPSSPWASALDCYSTEVQK